MHTDGQCRCIYICNEQYACTVECRCCGASGRSADGDSAGAGTGGVSRVHVAAVVGDAFSQDAQMVGIELGLFKRDSRCLLVGVESLGTVYGCGSRTTNTRLADCCGPEVGSSPF